MKLVHPRTAKVKNKKASKKSMQKPLGGPKPQFKKENNQQKDH